MVVTMFSQSQKYALEVFLEFYMQQLVLLQMILQLWAYCACISGQAYYKKCTWNQTLMDIGNKKYHIAVSQ